ncbi:MerR family transcriptional regulator [Metabacillus fastidiosus]|uniref:MerR family transcriptional regulator n=1 Tax=Metabacillus fastidiosus TaxID=1458 RepID=UPI002E1F0019|nr:MerR family transcriptional regulator [Metabacillus fastidiosus]MED4533167.1 MerR family transcriptional regulator [Metabacillus fastidiosus]
MKQINTEMTYNITQVANITGLSKQVIRKWEERYEVISPKRLDNGYRVYSEKEVNTLLYMKSLVEKGQTVKQAAIHTNKQLETEPLEQEENTNLYNTPDKYLHSLLSDSTLCNEDSVNRILQQAYHSYGLEAFLNSIIIPFLTEVGQRWSDGRWGEYQEALASLAIRDFLVQMRRNFQFNDNAPLLLGACLPHERHEIPLHIILLQCMLKGWKTVILGPSPAPTAIQSTVQQLKPKKVILSAVTVIPFEENTKLLQELDEFAGKHPSIQFYIGGPGAIQYAEKVTLEFIKVTNSIHDIL